jgi:predicted nucleotidyltransferase
MLYLAKMHWSHFSDRAWTTVKKGGDIDLFIKCNDPIPREELYPLKLKFLIQLKKRIGDQKIDVLIDGGQQNNTIFKTIANEGILL